ncbi:cyclin-like protein [Gorgonomyces haynaldii]|nr:cyclin-like protein [Gorgonomyces haynaldii]
MQSFWESTQHQWKTPIRKQQEYDTKLNLYYTSLLFKLGKKMSLRQQVIASSLVYFKRFFSRNTFTEVDPLLVLVTCFYVACKMEECPQHIKACCNEAKAVIGSQFTYAASDVAEFEFYLLEELDFCTILFHPYKPYLKYCQFLQVNTAVLQTGWYIINDIYRTDACLLYPPYIIAIAALYLSVNINEKEIHNLPEIKEFFKTLNIDFVQVVEIIQMVFNLYAEWKDFSPEQIPAILSKIR